MEADQTKDTVDSLRTIQNRGNSNKGKICQ